MFRKIFQKRGQDPGQPDEAKRKKIYHELLKREEKEKDIFAKATVEQAARSGENMMNAVVRSLFEDNVKAPPFHLKAVAKIQAKYGMSERQVEDIYKEFSGSSYF